MRTGIKIAIILSLVVIFSYVAYYLITEYYLPTTEESDNGDDQQNFILLRQEVREDLQKLKMVKRLKDNRGLIYQKDDFKQISNYQKYVTPDNLVVKQYQQTNGLTTLKSAYEQAVDWIWVSDQTLHGQTEKWLLPAGFIKDTPNNTLYPNNPVPGNMVSDCESQAYTLVSILEALGTSKTNVRVVVGNVNFSGEISGHAWVQVYENNQWFELEATSGPYWDDDDKELVRSDGFIFSYFKTHPYPVEEYWAFFNDAFYYDPDPDGLKSPDLPGHWLQTS
jgi:competence protein ComGF